MNGAEDLLLRSERKGLPPFWLQVILGLVAGAVALLLGVAVYYGWDRMVARMAFAAFRPYSRSTS